MKHLYLIMVSFLVSSVTFSQMGDGTRVINDPRAEARSVGSFNGVNVATGINLVIKQGNADGVAVSASETKYRDKIKTIVENGTLRIYYDNGKFWNGDSGNKQLKAYVSVKTLGKLSGSSGSNIVVDGPMNSSNLDIDLSSGSNLKGEIRADELSINQSSGSNARLSGKAKSLRVETSSGSGFYGYDLNADLCDAHASSGSHIEVTVNKEMEGRANSGGGIRYKGNGIEKHGSTTSGGSLTKHR